MTRLGVSAEASLARCPFCQGDIRDGHHTFLDSGSLADQQAAPVLRQRVVCEADGRQWDVRREPVVVELTTPCQRGEPCDCPRCTSLAPVLEMFVVYDRPSDFPHTALVRRVVISDGESTPDLLPCIFSPTLDGARAALIEDRPDLVNLGRHPDDDPCIVEVWV